MLFYFQFLQNCNSCTKRFCLLFPRLVSNLLFAFRLMYLYVLITRSCGQQAEVFQNKQNSNVPNNGQIQRDKKTREITVTPVIITTVQHLPTVQNKLLTVRRFQVTNPVIVRFFVYLTNSTCKF